MKAIGEITYSDSPRWGRALTRVWHQIYQLPEYVRLDAKRTNGHAAAFLYEEGTAVFLLPLVLHPISRTGWIDATSPYGYPGPVSNRSDPEFWRRAAASLMETLAHERLLSLFVRLDPLSPFSCEPLAEIGTLVTHGRTVSIDLRVNHDDWWSQMRKTHRQIIRSTVRMGRRSVMDNWAYLDDFVDMYQAAMIRVGATREYFFDRNYFEELHRALGDKVHLQVVVIGDEPIAGSVLLRTGAILQSHLAASRADHRHDGSDRFLTYSGAVWGAEQNCTAFHLGGGVGGREDSLFDYKKGFSPRRHEFKTLRIVTDENAYQELARKVDPLADHTDRSGYFPIYRESI